MSTPTKAKDILERLVLNNDITDSEYNYLISLIQVDNVSTTEVNWLEPILPKPNIDYLITINPYNTNY